jgi:hypothetical protein
MIWQAIIQKGVMNVPPTLEARTARGEPAPTITGWRVDRAAYAVVPLLSDGSEGAPLELRNLFAQFLDEVAPRA